MNPDMVAIQDAGLKRRALVLLAVVELLAMSLWFSASAVVPQLTGEWNLTGSDQAWLTMAVQIGFVVGAFLAAVFNIADRIAGGRLIAFSALFGAAWNLAIPLFSEGPGTALFFRFLTGVTMAGIYPPGMKVMASWCRAERGLCVGILVGALTVGSGIPHLLSAVASPGSTGLLPWRIVLYGSSALAVLASIIAFTWIEEGPFTEKANRFNWRYAAVGLTDRAARLANFGYFGHMWELYAMWAWAPLMLMASFSEEGLNLSLARYGAFAIFAAGGISSVLVGKLADRYGRTATTSISMMVSGMCCILIGLVFHSPVLLVILCAIWGFAVVADSAQFSTAITELADPRYLGTALQVQVSVGFLISMVTLRLIPLLVNRVGWEWAFLVLAIGPFLGTISMLRLRKLPESNRMARGNR